MKLSKYQGSKLRKRIYICVYYICTWRLTELAVGAQRTAGEGRTVRERPNPKSETMRDYNLKVDRCKSNISRYDVLENCVDNEDM